jgi:WD40 repeat protein
MSFRALLAIPLLLTLSAAALAETPEDELKKIAERAREGKEPLPAIRADLAALRMSHPGTPAAQKAAALLRTLPSPLDTLSRASIAAEQSVAWLPKEVVAVLGDHRGRHGAAVTAVAFSADGKRAASAGGTYIRLWDIATMRLLHLIHVGQALTSVAFNKEGSLLACTGSSGGAFVYSVTEGAEPKLKHTMTAPSPGAYSVCFSPDGKRIAWGTGEGVIRVFDVSGDKAVDVGTASGHTGAVQAVSWSPDGKLIASGSEDKTVRAWSATTFKETTKIEESVACTAIRFSPSGKTLTAGLADGTVQMWVSPPAARPKTPRAVFSSGKSAVTSLSYTSSGGLLAIANNEAAARVWSVSGKVALKARLGEHAGTASCVALSPDGKLALSGGSDWMARSFDLAKPRPVERFTTPSAHLSHVYAVAFSPDAASLATGSWDNYTKTWLVDRPAPEAKLSLKGEGAAVYSVAYSPDGKLLAAAGNAKAVRQWDPRTGKPKTSLTSHGTAVHQVAYSPDGKLLLTRGGKEVLLSDPGNGGVEHRFSHVALVNAAAWSPDGKHVATVSGYYQVDDKGRLLIKDGKYVYEDTTLRVFDAEKGGKPIASADTALPARDIKLFPTSRDLLVATGDNLFRAWKLEGEKLTETPAWKLAAGLPYTLLPSPDGSFALVQHSTHGFVKLSAEGKQLGAWTTTEALGGMALSPDSRHVALGLATGVVLILRIESAPATSEK